MKLQLLAAAASVALLAAPSLAFANDQGWYVRGNVGYGVVTDVDFVGDLSGDVEGEGNAAVSLGVGYEFGNNWRVELDASQLWNDLGAISQAGNTFSSMRLTTGMLNAIYDFSDFGSWEPYVGAGIGITRARLSAGAYSLPTANLPQNSPTCPGSNACTFDNADTGVAWQLLAGLGYKISDNLTWDTQYRYLNVGDLDYVGLGQNLSLPIAPNSTLGGGSDLATVASGAGSHTVMTGLRYRFGAKATPPPTLYSCWDGSRVENLSTCAPQPPVMVDCWDGSQVESGTTCPVRPVIQCWDGSTVYEAASCPTRPTITCWDGTIAYDQAACPINRIAQLCANEYRQEIIYYEFDKPQSAETHVKIQNILDTAANCSVGNINVVGHTDSSGSAAYNMKLSKHRARDVRAELIKQGVTGDIITSEGKGETQLFIDTGDGVKEALNRRTEILIRLNSVGVVTN